MMFRTIRNAAGAALDLLFPRGVACALCGAELDEAGPGPALCTACLTKLPGEPEHVCPGCGRGVPAPGPCRRCVRDGPPSDGGFAPFSYEGAVRNLLLAFKFHDRTGYRELFGDAMAGAVRGAASGVDCVVPVPMHWLRRFARGYNQSSLLAAWVAQSLGKPLLRTALSRPVYTPALSGADGGADERREAVRRSYRPGKADLAGKSVLLVDDILTTGATVRACAALLRGMGAKRVLHVVAAAVPD